MILKIIAEGICYYVNMDPYKCRSLSLGTYIHAFFMPLSCNCVSTVCNADVSFCLSMYNVCALLRGVRHTLNHLWHGDFTVFLEGVHHQTIAADVVNAL